MNKNKFLSKRYNAYNDYIKKKYGQRIQKVTVDAGFTCPNRDGKVTFGGCTYCNNESFNPGYNSASKSITRQINEGIEFLQRRYHNVKKFIVYFQPYSNTYAPLNILQKYYQEALSHPQVIGLTIGTRPDCVDPEKLKYLESLAQNYDLTIEYGLESISDESLKKINRGHDFQSYLDAINLTANRGIKICTHIILGFPWENKEFWIKTAKVLSGIPFHFLKIHQLHVVKNTLMANDYKKNPFKLLSYDEYIEVVVSFLERLNSDIIIQRLAGEAPPHILIAPKWGKRNSEILQAIDTELERRNTWQGRLYKSNI